ncbi:hypothetical protein U3516DRAFT_740484 [Neocallimastix sp. 'constans']
MVHFGNVLNIIPFKSKYNKKKRVIIFKNPKFNNFPIFTPFQDGTFYSAPKFSYPMFIY